jgi:hypothetical protein
MNLYKAVWTLLLLMTVTAPCEGTISGIHEYQPGTFSIVAYDFTTGELGVAVGHWRPMKSFWTRL